MKLIIAFLISAVPLHGQLQATFHTKQGNVVVELQYDKTPQTVANFITLAQATRSRIDPMTGAVIRKPLYVGETFYRVENTPDQKFAQTGSGTGTVIGDPGYSFRDEFHMDLRHDPYVLAMVNNGIGHNNGSQIYFTGNVSMPDLDQKNTVFGLVTDSASRTAIDAILTAGENATTIESVTFQRIGPGAVAFNEQAQGLPVCDGVGGLLEVAQEGIVSYVLDSPQGPGTVFLSRRSEDLQSWGPSIEIYQGTGFVGPQSIDLDTAQAPRAFFNLSLVQYPDALGPAFDFMANKRLVMEIGPGEFITFDYDGDGIDGVCTHSASPTSSTFTQTTYNPYPHKALWIINTELFGEWKFECLLDTETTDQIVGRNQAFKRNGLLWEPVGGGSLNLSK